VKELHDTRERAKLLPGHENEVFVVLFWRSGDARSSAVRRRCRGFDWPAGFRAVAVDVDACEELAAWFRPDRVPMLAVVLDGSILAVEFDMDEAARQRLIVHGQKQVLHMHESF